MVRIAMIQTLAPTPAATHSPGTHATWPIWLRLPKPGARCPYTGLSRGTLVELVLPCPVNDNRPPVRSVCLKKKNAIRGIRLIDAASLAQHLAHLADEQTPAQGARL